MEELDGTDTPLVEIHAAASVIPYPDPVRDEALEAEDRPVLESPPQVAGRPCGFYKHLEVAVLCGGIKKSAPQFPRERPFRI